jgi:hypothetical protein
MSLTLSLLDVRFGSHSPILSQMAGGISAACMLFVIQGHVAYGLPFGCIIHSAFSMSSFFFLVLRLTAERIKSGWRARFAVRRCILTRPPTRAEYEALCRSEDCLNEIFDGKYQPDGIFIIDNVGEISRESEKALYF